MKPHCPKCKGKPTDHQRPLTESERDRIGGVTGTVLAARFSSAYLCKDCASVYSYRDGFSTYVTRLKFARAP
jgi:hypothetical protein